jgi:hypothetical protein
MKKQFCKLNIVVLVATSIAICAKPLQWQMGKVLDTQRNSYFAGTVGSGTASGSTTTTGTATATGGMASGTATSTGSAWSTQSSTAVYRVFETFVIEGEDYAYVASERLRWRWSHPANLAVNGQVKYAIDGRKLIVIDDDGKQHEMEIVKRILKTNATHGAKVQ